MSRFVALALTLVLVAGLAACEWPPDTRYVHAVFTDVDVTTVVYRRTTTFEGNPIDLVVDIYQPRGDTASKRPAVMWMFGGAWMFGDTKQMTDYATDSARRGYVGVSVQYRIRAGGGPDYPRGAAFDAYDDAVAAAQWLRANASQYRIDPDAVIAGGWSAGAINALNLLYLPGSRGPATSPVAAAVSIAGFSFAQPTAGRPPAILHHGTADATVQPADGQRTCDQAKDAGNLCEFVSYDGGSHFIKYDNRDEITVSTATFLFERVLIPRGYNGAT